MNEMTPEPLRSQLHDRLRNKWRRRGYDPDATFRFHNDDELITANLSDGSELHFRYNEERIKNESVATVFKRIVNDIGTSEDRIRRSAPD